MGSPDFWVSCGVGVEDSTRILCKKCLADEVHLLGVAWVSCFNESFDILNLLFLAIGQVRILDMLGDFLKVIIIKTLVVEANFSWKIEVHLSQIIDNFVNPFLGSSGMSLGS